MDQPIIWIIPLSALILDALLLGVNMLLGFIPVSVLHFLLPLASGLVCSTVSSFIFEASKGRSNTVFLCVSLSLLVGYGSFRMFSHILSFNVIEPGLSAASPINELLSNIALTVLPGLFVGAFVGGGFVLVPSTGEVHEEVVEPSTVEIVREHGFVKICRRCGSLMPYDSLYCDQCGGALKRSVAPPPKYCRYCGKKLSFVGSFCPECGKEINLVSKPKVYVESQ